MNDVQHPDRNVHPRVFGPADNQEHNNQNQRLQLCVHVQIVGIINQAHTKICSPMHASASIGLLQLVSGNPFGIIGALGFNNRSAWICDSIESFFKTMAHFLDIKP